MPSIDIDRDAAHQAAQRELAKPIYPKESPIQRFHDWLDDLMYRVLHAGASMPGGWFTVSVLLILLAIGAGVAIHVARRTLRTTRGDRPMFDRQLSAAQHRATAEEFAAQGDWAAAIRHRLRAVARSLEDSGVISPMAGRTANELARDAGACLPHLASEMSQAAIAFNDVTYGGRPGTPDAYQLIADLDEHLGSRFGAQVR
ncbi:MAG TPA: DUF4129 domain-containing protein [Mycobacterium sp.]|uniref:DUF4129 domain-containing protein n=1 Tax=Mycobacterium sp. TaxID=1785 RepID=UPI002D574C79|nr:DUF4129 domain-containing protein [Mycobacterium sp.]HZU49440.1 DUF4129 domain-containing protein [Mycobacterium sp.]